MITATEIRNGESYLKVHLSRNDYYSEGESITGHWWGKGTERLGLQGKAVTETDFEAIRSNRHPATGDKLTPRNRQVAFHDVVVSAPKSFSVMAQVGGDERLAQAFEEVCRRTFQELEKFAAVRVRHGHYARSEAYRFTGNAVAAAYHHDTSRLLDPQHHYHLVFGNLSYCEEGNRWLALQRRPMMEASKRSVRQFFHRELARRTRELGYEIEWGQKGFRIKGISRELERRFSSRAIQREQFEKRYQATFGKTPDKRRIEQFIKEGKQAAVTRFSREYQAAFGRSPTEVGTSAFVQDWRSSKMAKATRQSVRAGQQARLNEGEKRNLQGLRARAENLSAREIEQEEQREQLRQDLPENKGKETSEGPGSEIQVGAGQQGVSNPSPQTAHRRSQRKRHRARPDILHSRSLAHQRMEVLRRWKRGMLLTSALRGFPGAFFAHQLTQLSRQRNQA